MRGNITIWIVDKGFVFRKNNYSSIRRKAINRKFDKLLEY